ncbi:MAG: hypothetical protein KDK36_11455 [Leptospiraceae bacterium]|nr:hypothetical protein [Leptospiraceae bacterium]
MGNIDKKYIDQILDQMIFQEKQFTDVDKDYFNGEDVTYYFDKEKETFICRKIDVVALSYKTEKELTQKELKKILSSFPLDEFLLQGFDIR